LETKLAKIAQVAKEKPKEQFTSLVHLLKVGIMEEGEFKASKEGTPQGGLCKVDDYAK